MRRLFLPLIVLALAAAPIAFGHGMHDPGVKASHASDHVDHLHDSCSGPDCTEIDISTCCGSMAGHCTSGAVLTKGTSIHCPLTRAVHTVFLNDQWLKGLGPEAETSPPRV